MCQAAKTDRFPDIKGMKDLPAGKEFPAVVPRYGVMLVKLRPAK